MRRSGDKGKERSKVADKVLVLFGDKPSLCNTFSW